MERLLKTTPVLVAIFIVLTTIVSHQPLQAASSSLGDTACCFPFGNAGPWGGSAHFTDCIVSNGCSSSQSVIAVQYVDSITTCPSKSYDCLVTASHENAGWNCCHMAGCNDTPAPSCCQGTCRTTCDGVEVKNPICADTVYTAKACCFPDSIQVLSSIQAQAAPKEWIVSWGYQVP